MSKISLTRDGSKICILDENGVCVVKYDFNGGLYLNQNDREIKLSTTKSKLSNVSLEDTCSDDNDILKLMALISKSEYYFNKKQHSKVRNIGSIISRFPHFHMEEKLIRQGFDVDRKLSQYISEKVNNLSKSLLKVVKDNNIPLSNIPKYIQEKYFIELYNYFKENNINVNFDFINNNWESIQQLLDLGYNYKSLVDYMIKLRDREGFDISSSMITCIRDYANMSSSMGRFKNGSKYGKFEKYPKFLKTTHDIVAKNYYVFKKEHDVELFKMSIDKDLEYTNKKDKYCIIVPKTPNDIINEGQQLNHCVYSYVDYILEKKLQIVFMRDIDNIEEPLVTVEIKHGRITQYAGHSNRKLTDDELEYLLKYAIEKNLKLNVDIK
ncbi:MAG: PcfJ domain-containing protein [Cetobacterium sp.]